jgi:hydroxyethylthiazole kinase
MTDRDVWRTLSAVRTARPLVHNITNYVVMNSTANALLALGASPAMAHAAEEVEDFVDIAQVVVINIGTLSPSWVAAMKLAAARAATRL